MARLCPLGGKTPLMLSRPVYAPSPGILRDAARAVGERPEGAGTIPAFGHGFRSAREGGGGGGGVKVTTPSRTIHSILGLMALLGIFVLGLYYYII